MRLLAFALLMLWSAPALATAGFAEYSYVMSYSDRAVLWWGANSDICSGAKDRKKNCFTLWPVKKEEQVSAFYNDQMLWKISIPAKPDADYALAQAFFSDDWVIYDLREREGLKGYKQVLRVKDYASALAEWKRLGQPDPSFATTEELDRHFKQLSCDGLFC